MEQPIREKGVYIFGPYRLDPDRRSLKRDGKPIQLTPRLFDTLTYLVENHDRLVERDELERAVWRDRSVVVSNLSKAISALRKALQADGPEDNLIVTVSGRGFRFGAMVVFEPATAGPAVVGTDTGSEQAGAGRLVARAWIRVRLPVLAIAACALTLWYLQKRPDQGPSNPLPPFSPPPHSVAVLAFTNLSGDPGQAYFSDGLSEELIDSLSRIGTLHVAARLSAFSFRDKAATIQEIARALNVGTVLEGSVRRDGPRLRITAQLIDGVTGYELWSHSYDREEGDIFRMQCDIAQAVAASLQVNLVGPDMARFTRGGTSNPKALDAYLRAMAAQETPDDTLAQARQIIAAFNEAVTLDPNFAVAQAQRAIALWHIASSNDDPNLAATHRMKDDALATAQRAVALAPDLAVAHLALGIALDDALPDFSQQEAAFVRARELAPGSSEIARYYGRFEVLAGHTLPGIEAAEQAASLDPLTPRTYYLLAGTLYLAGRGDEALAALRHARDLGAPDSIYAAALAGFIALMKGDAAAARVACSGKTDWQIDLCLAIADHALGKTQTAADDFARLRNALGQAGAYNYAQVYAQWGRTDDALHWLEAAYDLHDPGMIQLRADPLLDPIRRAPRFQVIEIRLGFPPS
jgi:TolB-like protein/DNA-binding winged helix-turn-helix (wHTH) protein/Flp pilus assembly protein TadD